MKRLLVIAGLLAAWGASAAAARAQWPAYTPGAGYPGYPGVMPNYFSPQVTPLSPYLRLFRGLDPAVSYYYDVRPALQARGYYGPVGVGGFGSGAPRQTFFPVVDTLYELEPGAPGEAQRMPTTGHPVGFNNAMGYFPQFGPGAAAPVPAGAAAPPAAGRAAVPPRR
ncbi:MAG TPA: hypothetical protein VIL46_00130 [Gemmataceae bacterium]